MKQTRGGKEVRRALHARRSTACSRTAAARVSRQCEGYDHEAHEAAEHCTAVVGRRAPFGCPLQVAPAAVSPPAGGGGGGGGPAASPAAAGGPASPAGADVAALQSRVANVEAQNEDMLAGAAAALRQLLVRLPCVLSCTPCHRSCSLSTLARAA
jgi:hypothetical protein